MPQKLLNRFRQLSKTGIVTTVLLIGCAYILYTCCQVKQAELEERQAELRKLKADISMAEFTNAQLRAQVAHLSTDAGAEEVAREKLGLIKPGEISFVVLGESKPAQKVRPKAPEPVQEQSLLMNFMHWLFLG